MGTPIDLRGEGHLICWQGSAALIVEGRDFETIGRSTSRITTMTVDRTDFRLSRQAIQKAEAAVVAAAIAQYRSKASSYTKQFGYSLYEIREVTVQHPNRHARRRR